VNVSVVASRAPCGRPYDKATVIARTAASRVTCRVCLQCLDAIYSVNR
jgi:hypothetical protein